MQTATNDRTVGCDVVPRPLPEHLPDRPPDHSPDPSPDVEHDIEIDSRCQSRQPLRHFPPVIERALAILAGSDAVDFAGLSMDARMLLARYVRYVDARTPQQAVRVANQTLAIGLGVSARTVNKLKAVQVANGWIRSTQQRSRRHGMQICQVLLSVKVLALLELAYQPSAGLEQPWLSGIRDSVGDDSAVPLPVAQRIAADRRASSEADSTMAAAQLPLRFDAWPMPATPLPVAAVEDPACAIAAPRASEESAHACRAFFLQPLQGQPAGPSLVDKSKKSNPNPSDQVSQITAGIACSADSAHSVDGTDNADCPNHRQPASNDGRQRTGQGIRLPQPLRWLLAHMSAPRVCLLMREAGQRKTRLEDVVRCCAEQIRAARNAFAYLRTLLGQDRDWAWLATRQDGAAQAAEQATHAAGQAAASRRKVQDGIAALAGQAFIGGDGLVRRIEAGMALVYTPEEASKRLGRPFGCQAAGRRVPGSAARWPASAVGPAPRGRGGVNTWRPDVPSVCSHWQPNNTEQTMEPDR